MAITGLTILIACVHISHIDVVWATDCPDTWVAFQGSCYLFPHGMAMTFFESEHYCRQHHKGHLVHVNSAMETAFLKQYLQQLKDVSDRWIGLTDETIEGVWAWSDDDTPLNYTDWAHGEPNSDHRDEDCAAIWQDHGLKWADLGCLEKYAPLCEISNSYAAPEILG